MNGSPRTDAAMRGDRTTTELEVRLMGIACELERENARLRDAIQASVVFITPLERLKNWNAYKEDASRRIRTALNDES